MEWILLSLKNQRRRPVRTLVSVVGVAICVATLFSLLAFQRGYRSGMQGEMDRLGAHILVVPKGCPYDAASIALHGAKWPCYLQASYLDSVRTTYNVATAAPMFMSAFYEDNGDQTVYVGVDRNILRLKKGWTIRGVFPCRPWDLLVGSDAARRHGWNLNARVALPDLPGRTGTVSGILAPTQGADDTFLYMRLPDAQAAFGHPHELTHILVKLKDPEQLDRTVAQLHSCSAGLDMNVVPLTHLFSTINTLVSTTRLLLGAVLAVALLIAGAGVTNTVLMAVVERTREIGVMRAMGASRMQIFGLFWLESLQVCLFGGLVGIALATAGAHGVETWLRTRLPFAPTDPLIRWEWWIAASCLGAVALLGSLAGLLPAARAARLAPLEAIRA